MVAGVDALDGLYGEVLDVARADYESYSGESVDGLADLSKEERQFEQWRQALGESTKRFIGATGHFIRTQQANGEGTGLNNYMADNESARMCEYLVKHWDRNPEGALDVVRNREVELLATGKAHGLTSASTALGFKPIHPLSQEGLGALQGVLSDEFVSAIRRDALEGLQGAQGEEEYTPAPDMSDADWLDTGVLMGIAKEVNGEWYVLDGIEGMDLQGLAGVEGLDGWWSKFKKWTKKTYRKAAGAVKRAYHKAKRWTKRSYHKAKDAVKRGASWTKRKLKSAAKFVAKKTKSAFHGLKNVVGKTVDFVKKGVTYVWDKTKGLCKKVGNALVKVVKYVGKALKALAKKIKDIAVRFAKWLNPKNIMCRLVTARRIRRGKHGLANGMYFGMVGWGKAQRLGCSRKDYDASKRAYDKTLRNMERWGSSKSVLDKAIQSGYRPGKTFQIATKAEIAQGVRYEQGQMNAKQIVAQEQDRVYAKQGVSKQDRQKAQGVHGLGIAISSIITIVVSLINMIIGVIGAYLKRKREEKEEEAQEKQNAENLRRARERAEDEKKLRALNLQKAQMQVAAMRKADKEIAALRKSPGGNRHLMNSTPLPSSGGSGKKRSLVKPLLITGGLLAAGVTLYMVSRKRDAA